MRFNFNPNKQNGLNLFASNEIKLNDIYCLPLDESRKLSLGARLLLLLLSCWLSACILCTWLRRRRRRQSALPSAQRRAPANVDQLIEMLAIDVNLKQFFSPKQQKQQRQQRVAAVNLDVLDSVKHLGCVGVVGAHVFLAYLSLGTAYGHTLEQVGKDMRTMLLLSLNNQVDTFLLISGLLGSYFALRRLDAQSQSQSQSRSQPQSEQDSERRATADWLKKPLGLLANMAAARYLRMAPLYFLVYAAAKWLAAHLGSGPLWDYATNGDSLRGLCRRESWLWPLAFASNLKPIAHHCVPAAWSLAVDLQFCCLLMPALVLALKRWPASRSYSLVGLLVCLSSWSALLDYRALLLSADSLVSPSDFAKLRLHVFAVLIKHSARAGYSRLLNRMGPILIGLLGGHLLRQYERRATEQLSRDPKAAAESNLWPRYMRGNCFRLALAGGLLFGCAPALVRLRERARGPSSASAAATRRLLRLALGVDWTSPQLDSQLVLLGFVLIKPLWSVCNLLVLLRLCTDLRRSPLGRLMAMAGWRRLSQLNYAILLVHFELVAYEAMSRLAQTPIGWPELLSKFCFAYVCSLAAGLLLHVLVERPAHKLTSRFLFSAGASASASASSAASTSVRARAH